jgi:rubrerythrin
MTGKQALELWCTRFNRILELELEAVDHYQKMLHKYDHLLGGTRIKHLIRGIMRDEGRHATIAKRLVQIVEDKRKERGGDDNDKR